MVIEYPDAFLFKFDIYVIVMIIPVMHTNLDYTYTLKGDALRWFMGLGEHTIAHWDDMRNIFLKEVSSIL
jgi:hypothetical protein